MSLVGQWDTVNGKVWRCLVVQASMDLDHQFECHTISYIKPMELLIEQLRQSRIKVARVTGDMHGSMEYSL